MVETIAYAEGTAKVSSTEGKKVDTLRRLALCAVLACMAPLAFASPPQTLYFQGFLAGSSGGAPVSGAVNMTFRIYNASGGGTQLWIETQMSVAVVNGSFNTLLGSVAPLALPFDVPYWVSVAVNGDGEMSPRIALSGAPYAFRSNGLVACTTGITNCSGSCTNLSNDATNCGVCGNACAAGHACATGACQ